jgi:hypothetical protein
MMRKFFKTKCEFKNLIVKLNVSLHKKLRKLKKIPTTPQYEPLTMTPTSFMSNLHRRASVTARARQ